MSRPLLPRELVKLHADLPRKSMRRLTLRITAAEARDLELQTIRPPAGTSVENKLTVILPPGQVDFLDRLSLDIRSKTKAKVKRTEIIRALIAGLMGSGLALSGFDSEETIAATIAERKKGFFSRP